MKHKYIKPAIESSDLECYDVLLADSPIEVPSDGEMEGIWAGDAKREESMPSVWD